MESLQQISSRYRTDKAEFVHYLANYESLLNERREKDIKLLELGVLNGGSLLMWRDYFPNGRIAGLDINSVVIDDPSGRISCYGGKQEDALILDKIASEVAPEGFDIIIDDCAHIGRLSRLSYRHLFDKHLKSGGCYVIEDWGTGYWDTWPDGTKYRGRHPAGEIGFTERLGYALTRNLKKHPDSWFRPLIARAKAFLVNRQTSSHDAGMVGFVKELLDECSVEVIDHPEHGAGQGRTSDIQEIRVFVSHLFVIKK